MSFELRKEANNAYSYGIFCASATLRKELSNLHPRNLSRSDAPFARQKLDFRNQSLHCRAAAARFVRVACHYDVWYIAFDKLRNPAQAFFLPSRVDARHS